MDITCVADLHGHYPELEGGDLLIVAGDWTANDSEENLRRFEGWLLSEGSSKYKKIVVVAGNHDNSAHEFAKSGVTPYLQTLPSMQYLRDSGTEYEGFKIWGSPWTQTFEGMNPKCKAFTFDSDEDLEEKWALTPNDIDILITHSPPYGLLDEVDSQEHCTSYHAGSRSLLKRVCEIRPVLHVFGHIHEGHGEDIIRDWKRLKIEESGITQDIKDVTFINASHVNERYEPVNKPIRVIL